MLTYNTMLKRQSTLYNSPYLYQWIKTISTNLPAPMQTFLSLNPFLIHTPHLICHCSCHRRCRRCNCRRFRSKRTVLQTRTNRSWKWLRSSPSPSWIWGSRQLTSRCPSRRWWPSRSWLALEVCPRTTRNWLPNFRWSTRDLICLWRPSRRR